MDEKESNLRRTGERNGGWTVETLREYVISILNAHDEKYEQRFEDLKATITMAFESLNTSMKAAFDSQKEAVTAALAAADRAVAKAEVASEKRFDAVNEFRGTLSDQQRNLMPRSEAELMIRSMSDKIDLLQRAINLMSGQKSGIQQGWGYAVGVIGFIMMILSFLGVFGRVAH